MNADRNAKGVQANKYLSRSGLQQQGAESTRKHEIKLLTILLTGLGRVYAGRLYTLCQGLGSSNGLFWKNFKGAINLWSQVFHCHCAILAEVLELCISIQLGKRWQSLRMHINLLWYNYIVFSGFVLELQSDPWTFIFFNWEFMYLYKHIVCCQLLEVSYI